MSPSSSAIPQTDSIRKAQLHSRTTSATIPLSTSTQETDKSSNQPFPSPARRPFHYTLFIRLPFPRNDFQDPPPVEWDGTKDKALWKLISKASNSKDLDWEEMSVRFEVSLPFLLQQAAWLYERHFEGMRAQMMKLGGGVSERASPSPAQQVEGGGSQIASAGGVAMQRMGSKDSTRVPSAIDTLKISPLPPGETGSSPGTPRSAKPAMSRTPSTNTVTQSRVFVASTKQPLQQALRGSSGSQKRAPQLTRPVDSSQDDDDMDELGHDRASESDSEEEPSIAARNQALRRSVFNKKPEVGTLGSDGDAEDDEDDSSGGGYLPFAATSRSTKDDPAATLRSSPKRQTAVPQPNSMSSKGKIKEQPPASSTSSASSMQQPQQPSSNDSATETTNRHGPISPRRRAGLEKFSPRHRKSGSEGSPSMGSSFSDLDDASVTQSALEDALMSNMQHGSIGMGSRMSGLKEALGRK